MDGPKIDLQAIRPAFDDKGYAVIENFANAAECQMLMDEAARLVNAFNPEDALTVFSPKDQSHAKDEYFKTSGDKIRCFLEEHAVDENGQLRQPKQQSINKIGHALHDLNPAFNRFSRQDRYRLATEAIGLTKPLLLQSMMIFKHAHIGGEVNCHQDSTFLYTEPMSVVGIWLALEDATKDNGCLWALSGGHKQGLRHRFRTKDDELIMECLDPTPFDLSEAEPLEVPAGTAILLHGCLPHFSGANHSPTSRQAYVVHLIDGSCAYAEDNWLQRAPDMPLRGF